MRNRIILFWLKLRLSLSTTAWLLGRWQYSLFAVLFAFFFFELLYWSFNMQVASSILFSPNVTVAEKAQVAVGPFVSIYQVKGPALTALMIALAIVQGVIVSALVYIVRAMQKIDDNLVGGGALVTLLAVLGVGCPSCGTSLITPVVALFVSGSAVATSEYIANILTPIALALAVIGLYVVGLRAAGVRAKAKQRGVLAETNVNDLQ